MKVKSLILGFIILFLFLSCDKKIESPYSPDIPVKAELIFVEKNLSISTELSGGVIIIWGMIKNTGNTTAKRVGVSITIYNDDDIKIWGPAKYFVCARLSQGNEVEFYKNWDGIDSNIVQGANRRKSHNSLKITFD